MHELAPPPQMLAVLGGDRHDRTRDGARARPPRPPDRRAHPSVGAGTRGTSTAPRCGRRTSPTPLRCARDGFRGERFDVLLSCLASRTGAPRDAWAIDHRAHVDALAVAETSGIGHVILLSAICVQKPRLAFQHAKLAFEQALVASGLRYSIVRPTAYFKSLSGQVERVRRGRPFLVFGDGRLTACKPISNDDLADYMVDCIDDPARHDRILPIGGPGPAHHAAGTGRSAMRGAGPRAAFPARARGAARRDRRDVVGRRTPRRLRSRRRPSWRASAATTRPSRCSCSTRRPDATTRMRRRRPARRRCSSTMRGSRAARCPTSVATTRCSDGPSASGPAEGAIARGQFRRRRLGVGRERVVLVERPAQGVEQALERREVAMLRGGAPALLPRGGCARSRRD